MAQKTGTIDLSDLLAVRYASPVQYGLDTIQKVLNYDLNQLDKSVMEEISWFAEPTSERGRIYGTSATILMMDADEYATPVSKKNTVGENVNFPMRKFQSAIGWTNDYLKVAKVSDLAQAAIQVKNGYLRELHYQVKRAIYNDTNYTSYDILIDNYALAIKRLINADSTKIADGPDGTTFDGSTHTHYTARVSTLAATDIDAVISNVTEHGHTQGLRLVIAQANLAAISALSGFRALTSSLVVVSNGIATKDTLDIEDLSNRMVGYWNDSVQVWVKPWAVSNYVLCIATGTPEKVLCYRQREQESLRGLRVVAHFDEYPLISDNMEAEFGFGVWNRTAAAVLYIGGTSWANPTITR